MDNQNILAVVAGEEITQKDLDALIAALPKEQQAYAGNEHFRNQCLEHNDVYGNKIAELKEKYVEK